MKFSVIKTLAYWLSRGMIQNSVTSLIARKRYPIQILLLETETKVDFLLQYKLPDKCYIIMKHCISTIDWRERVDIQKLRYSSRFFMGIHYFAPDSMYNLRNEYWLSLQSTIIYIFGLCLDQANFFPWPNFSSYNPERSLSFSLAPVNIPLSHLGYCSISIYIARRPLASP